MKKVSATILLILASSALMFVMYIITAMSLLAVVGVPLALALSRGMSGRLRLCRNASKITAGSENCSFFYARALRAL